MAQKSKRRQREEQEVGEALAKWLRAALLKPDGSERMTKGQVIELAGVGRTGFWRILRGQGAESEPDTLAKIADVLGVPTPRIHLTVDLQGQTEPRITSPITKLREAQALIREAVTALEEPATPAAAAAKAAHRAVEKQAGHQPKRRSG